jgi:foldase protein PrsA
MVNSTELRRTRRILSLGLAVSLAGTMSAMAQAKRPAAEAGQPAKAVPAPSSSTPTPEEPKGQSRLVRIPVNPSDPVAIVNGEVITRQQLSDECVARKGEEILETLMTRKLIEQALKAKKLEVTAAEIEAEIERVAMSMAGITKEQWLRTLSKERGIQPAQYARDIIYPALALRKLATPRVQVTDSDLKDALESQFGEQLVYRMIMTRSLDHAKLLWEELKKNPGGFENLARNDPRSIDAATRSDGGKPMNGPLRRHSYPREVTDLIFAQLVDGNPEDLDPTHKPKDGEITGPIQVTDETWIIVKREGVLPVREYKADDPDLIKQMKQTIFDSKIQQHMELILSELTRSAAIENKLTGTIKTASHELPEPLTDGEIKLMSQQHGAQRIDNSVPPPTAATQAAAAAAAAEAARPAPPGVSQEDLETRANLSKNTSETATKK